MLSVPPRSGQDETAGVPELRAEALIAWQRDPSSLSTIIEIANRAISQGHYDLALRYADRAWRMSSRSPLVCQILISLLLRRGDADHALRILDGLEPGLIHADLAALHVDALKMSGQAEAARTALDHYLGLLAVETDGALARAACSLVAEHPGWGWIGVTPGLRVTGRLPSPGEGAQLLAITLPGSDEKTMKIAAGDPEHCGGQLGALPATSGMRLHIVDLDTVLIGGRITFPPDFGLSGSIVVERTAVSGTIGLSWNPQTIAPRLFVDRKTGRQPVPLRPDDTAPGRWRFSIPVGRLDRLTQAQLGLSVALPDGRTVPFPGSPVSFSPVRPYRARSSTPRPDTGVLGTAIVIPIYRGEDETRACIESVLESVPHGAPIVLVDDASPEPGVTALIQEFEHDPRVTVITNRTNLGFPASANRGMQAVPRHDIILLNSDTIVFPGWLERLCTHATSQPRAATVTPLSNCGSIASYPGGEEGPCDRETARLRDSMAARINAGQHVEAPTGVGFCMFVRRTCLDQVGGFDEVLFGRGYGEENDFCLRASAHGWTHLIAGDVYVLHRNGVSFGSTRNGWMERNEAVLAARHPSYTASVAAFHEAQPIAPLRRQLDVALLRENRRPIVLLVSLALPGGVQKHVDARMATLEQQGYLPVLLRPGAGSKDARLTIAHGADFQDLRFRFADEGDAFRDLLDGLLIEQIEIHHFFGMDASFIDACFALGTPVDIHVHDFSWYCPRLSLLGTNGVYCGEPGADGCRSCIMESGSELHDALDPDRLRERSGHWLGQARNVFVACRDSAQRYARMFPDRNFRVAAWEQSPPLALPVVKAVPHRIAVIGAIGEQKGRAVLLACARHAALHNLPLEFLLAGFSDDEEALLQTGKVFITGRYDEAELPMLLQREAPSAIFLPSVTPETWSYSLSQAMATALPVMAFDIGAIAERLRSSSVPHRLIPLETTGAQINEMLMALQEEPQPEPVPLNRATASDTAPSAAKAADQPTSFPSFHAPGVSIMRDPGTTIVSTAEFLTLARGLYHFSVVSGGVSGSGRDASLPALQVVAAPGERKSDIEYVASPGAEHHWLREGKDSVILKVNGDMVTVVVILLTGPGLVPLQIDVRKLDGEQGAYAFADAPSSHQPIDVPGQPPVAPVGASLLRTQIVAHVEYVGDVIGIDQAWVGATDGGRAIECLSMTPMTNIAPASIEYRALSAAGTETPWVDQGRPCGTRGKAMPLLGFAIRQKPQGASRFSCEYSGKFASGRIVGPLRDGALCVSPLADDRLVGVWLHILDQADQPNQAVHPIGGARDPVPAGWRGVPATPAPMGPKFSVFREVSA